MTQKTLNLKVLAVSLAMAALLSVGLYLLHAWQLKRLSHSLLALADARESDEQWLESAALLDRYLQIDKRNAAVQVRMANVYAKGVRSDAEKRNAIALYYRALGANPPADQQLAVRSALANLLLETQRFSEAEHEALLAIEQDANHPLANRSLALALFAQWRNGSLATKALGELRLLAVVETARRLNPQDAALAEVNAAYYREFPQVIAAEHPELTEAQRYDRADACLDDLISSNPDDPKAYLARYQYRIRYHLTDADRDLDKAVELAPHDAKILLAAAAAMNGEAAAARGANEDAAAIAAKYSRSKELFEKLLAQEGDEASAEAHLALGDSQRGLGEIDAALTTWREGLKRFGRAPAMIQTLFHARIADALVQARRISEAGESLDILDRLIRSLDTAVTRDEFLGLMQAQDMRRAGWYLDQGNAASAIPLLQDVVARQAAGTVGNAFAASAWSMLGRANAALQEWADAAVAFDRVAPLDPKSAGTRLAAAQCWLQIGRVDQAIERAEQSLAIEPSAEASLILATADCEQQLGLPLKQREWGRVDSLLKSLESNPAARQIPSPWRIDFLQADYIIFRGRENGNEMDSRLAAQKVLERAEKQYSDAPDFWREACFAQQRLGNASGAQQALRKFKQLSGSVADCAIVEARLLSYGKDWTAARKALEQASNSASVADQGRIRSEIIQLALASGDLEQAQRLLEAEAKLRPRDVALLRRLCELAMQRSDFAALRRGQEMLAATGSAGAWWAQYFSAMHLVLTASGPQDPQLQTALDTQTKLAIARPHWALALTLRGAIEMRLGHLEAAADALEKAIQLGERRLGIYEDLIGLLDKLNRPEDAEKYLSRLEGSLPTSQRLTEFAGDHQLRNENPEQALSIARSRVKHSPDNAQAHLWLGRLLLVNKQDTEAEKEFEQALMLAPGNAQAWTAMFSFCLRTGDAARARQTLEGLEDKADLQPADKSFVLAQCYQLLGDLPAADKYYTTAAKLQPDKAIIPIRLAGIHFRTNPKLAEQHLRKALEIDRAAPEARRMLATLLASRGTSDALRDAELLLAVTDNTDPRVALEDRRLKAVLLAQSSDASQLARAVKIAEEIVTGSAEGLPADRVLLAQLYQKQAQSAMDAATAATLRNAAQQQLQTIVTRTDVTPTQIAMLVEFLLNNKQAADAAIWLEKLEALLHAASRDDATAIGQYISLRIQHGSSEGCEPWLKRLAAADKDGIRPLALQAQWLAAQERTTEIEPAIEPIAATILSSVKDSRQKAAVARAVGDIYSRVALRSPAVRWYRAAVEMDPAQMGALTLALAKDNQVAEALELCQQHAEQKPGPVAATVLAAALVEAPPAGRRDSNADAFLVQQLEQHGKDTGLLYAVATLRAIQERYEDSIRLYRQVIALEPRNVGALNNLAMMLADTPGQQAESLRLVEKAIEIAGRQPGLLDTKGAILVFQGQSQQAVPLLEVAAREAGNDPRHRFHLAAAYHGAGENAKARQQLQLALATKLEEQVLTPTDQRLLTNLKAVLIP